MADICNWYEHHALYVHTAKAISRNSAHFIAPGNRVFAVVKKCEDGRLFAWKCSWVGNRLDHPAFPGETLSLTDPRLFVDRGENGSEPTAVFRPDSFYREIHPAA